MPTYDYECLESGSRFEHFQNITEDPIEACPECGGPVRRLISGGGGLIFKGKGFYATDSRSSTRCGRGQTCCGRDTPCDTPACES